VTGNFFRSIYRCIRSSILQKIIPKSDSDFLISKSNIVEVIGFFESYSGIGESARLCALSLKDSGYKVKCTSVESVFRKKSAFKWSHEGFYTGAEKPALRIFHLNPPMLPPAIFSIGFKAYKQSYNIGYWAWELEDIPAEWRAALKYVNAVMTPSTFTTKAVQKHTDDLVVTVLHPVDYNLHGANDAIRLKLNIPASTFLISNIFSFGSALERKNPESLIVNFKQAFDQNEDVMLVLKSNSGSAEEKEHILALIGNDDRIKLIDESWDRADILGLTKASDLYASFHRSEGFGLTLAESLLLGTPVITTNWSGSMDFCNDKNAYLVETELVPVITSNREFKDCSGLSWAEVKPASAVLQLKNAYTTIKKTGKPDVRSLTISFLKQDCYASALLVIEKECK
jgi:glycosyltransferase involved in cell wall biosynthesis